MTTTHAPLTGQERAALATIAALGRVNRISGRTLAALVGLYEVAGKTARLTDAGKATLAAERETARVAATWLELADRCETCQNGCSCPRDDVAAGCGHYACWGAKATSDCPGVTAERAR